MDSLRLWIQRLRASRHADTSQSPVTAEHAAPVKWVEVESEGVRPIGLMHADVLRQAGISVLVRDWNPGSAVFGGVPVGVTLLVPSRQVAGARAILGLEVEHEEQSHEG